MKLGDPRCVVGIVKRPIRAALSVGADETTNNSRRVAQDRHAEPVLSTAVRQEAPRSGLLGRAAESVPIETETPQLATRRSLHYPARPSRWSRCPPSFDPASRRLMVTVQVPADVPTPEPEVTQL